MNIQTFTLPCGLRVIHERSGLPVLYCGYVVCAGTRHEEPQDTGMAHFIEHMSFKGTGKRRACHITNGLERVGGDLNAYTTKQETVYYATVLREDFARAADLLTDIVFHSTYPQREADKEIEVICDEIESYNDSPAELIFDEFEAMMYPGQPLGRDILGTPDRLRQYRTADALRFARRWYQPSNAVFYVYGDVHFDRVLRVLEKLLPAAAPMMKTSGAGRIGMDKPHPFCGRQERIVKKDTHQTHVLMGAPTFAGTDERRFALALLNNMLAGPGMNSRLNVAMRERAGLVYSVDSYINTYPDTGFWNVYFGCDGHDVSLCRHRVERELRRFIENPLTPAQLAAAKKQLIGQTVISATSAEGYALSLGKTYAHYGRHYDVASLCAAVREVSAEELCRVAAQVYAPESLTTLIYT